MSMLMLMVVALNAQGRRFGRKTRRAADQFGLSNGLSNGAFSVDHLKHNLRVQLEKDHT
jgi:hypothetical protein